MRLHTMAADVRRQQNQSATLSVLGTPGEILSGEVRNISSSGTKIWLDQPLRGASLVAIDYDGNRLLGEVLYCEKGQGGWLVGVRVEHALWGMETLAPLGEAY